VNSCLVFLGSLDGKQLITVEDLKSGACKLHPVQSSMVDLHGSQCGFCTPGFIMSLFALYKSEPTPTMESTEDALVGNLCRCTGYRTILDAAREMVVRRSPDFFSEQELETVKLLKSMRSEETIELSSAKGRFYIPRSVQELCRLRQEHPDGYLLAGGTDLGLQVTKQRKKLDPIICLSDVSELKKVVESDSEVRIGSAVTYTDALAVLEKHFPAFAQLVLRLGSRQIRNLGTIGGNLANASPIGDSPPALLALDAEVNLCSANGSRTVPLSEFFVGYRQTNMKADEILESIRVPLLKADEIFKTYKISKRFDQDISTLCAGIRVSLEGGRVSSVRVAFGGMAATPARASLCEKALEGKPWNEEQVCAAAEFLDQDFQPMTDFRGSARYRSLVAKNLLRKFFLESGTPGMQTGVL
ncbi:xanthine dehydrogenase small subunit, partial [bacterium]|nr:xanthine dehydrogenase small subunit [bacterium]